MQNDTESARIARALQQKLLTTPRSKEELTPGQRTGSAHTRTGPTLAIPSLREDRGQSARSVVKKGV